MKRKLHGGLKIEDYFLVSKTIFYSLITEIPDPYYGTIGTNCARSRGLGSSLAFLAKQFSPV